MIDGDMLAEEQHKPALQEYRALQGWVLKTCSKRLRHANPVGYPKRVALVCSTHGCLSSPSATLAMAGSRFGTVLGRNANTMVRCGLRATPAFVAPAMDAAHLRASRFFSVVRAQRDEEAAAVAAAATLEAGAPTIFDKIISREIPSSIVYEDDAALAFRDINPQAPVHVIIIPKQRDGLTQLSKASERHKDLLGQLLYAAKIVAEKEGLADGFRVVINDGPNGCQSVYHLHLHLIGGRQLKWPPG